jgi:hypothetical protein
VKGECGKKWEILDATTSRIFEHLFTPCSSGFLPSIQRSRGADSLEPCIFHLEEEPSFQPFGSTSNLNPPKAVARVSKTILIKMTRKRE